MTGVLAVVGVGGMGQAIARRLGSGDRILLADFNRDSLETTATRLRGDGFDVTTHVVDVSSLDSVHELAVAAAALGSVTRLAHTAGLSPVQASVEAILAVDLVGVAHVLAEFEHVIAPGGAGVVIASMGGHMMQPLPPEQEVRLARTPSDQIARLPLAAADQFDNGGSAYSFAKRANALRVRAASVAWGKKGARINSISPGVIATPMGLAELDSPTGGAMRAMIDGSAARRLGTPEDIATAAGFLLSPAAGFISGTDLLVDGGVVGALTTGQLDLGGITAAG
ncbi:SDR family oxidoreductase [Frondihabitans cladoniiphilus]|uniref:SDR family oxidoreductase n=1 Tax=Frondihabitans cladoniiphilus TaxID=715785 RepID=A0ABP8VMG0_9MICO